MSANPLGEHARALDEAWARAVAVPAPSTVDPELTTDDAYAIQDLVIAHRLQAGRRIGGGNWD